MKIIILSIFIFTFYYIGSAQIVNIPDANFKSLLVDNVAINTNNDTEIQYSEASSFTGAIAVSYWNITSLTGIESFTSLTSLRCNNNQLTSLDVTQNTALTFLDCSDNPINILDVTNNTGLTTLYCASNSLSILDVTQNTSLTFLNCTDNSLSMLDVTQNLGLKDLRCYDNSLSTLNLTQNIVLEVLDCSDNPLNILDLSQNTSLESLVCTTNSLSTLDLSINTSLYFLICNNNPLTFLNVANGNNVNFDYFRAVSNPNLTCIQVDDMSWSTANWANIDAWASFSTNCSILGIEEVPLQSISVYPNPVSDVLNVSSVSTAIERIEIFNQLGQLVLGNSHQESIDISRLRQGVYFCKIKGENGSFGRKKIVKN